MQTYAHKSLASADLRYEGTLCEPVELRLCEDGSHKIVLKMHPTASGLHTLVAHVPIEPGEAARRQAEGLISRINAAQKHGQNAIAISAPLAQHRLVCLAAQIEAHESHHPKSALPEQAPKVEKVADLFEATAA